MSVVDQFHIASLTHRALVLKSRVAFYESTTIEALRKELADVERELGILVPPVPVAAVKPAPPVPKPSTVQRVWEQLRRLV